MSRVRRKATATEASRVFAELRNPRPEVDGWSSVCPRHPGSLLQIRVRAGSLRSVSCASGPDCDEVERLKRLAAQ